MLAPLPASTLSNAPKIRAMQIISELEGTTRGPHATLEIGTNHR
jgi:anthranilate/para-aminobenzoate synthase component I